MQACHCCRRRRRLRATHIVGLAATAVLAAAAASVSASPLIGAGATSPAAATVATAAAHVRDTTGSTPLLTMADWWHRGLAAAVPAAASAWSAAASAGAAVTAAADSAAAVLTTTMRTTMAAPAAAVAAAAGAAPGAPHRATLSLWPLPALGGRVTLNAYSAPAGDGGAAAGESGGGGRGGGVMVAGDTIASGHALPAASSSGFGYSSTVPAAPAASAPIALRAGDRPRPAEAIPPSVPPLPEAPPSSTAGADVPEVDMAIFVQVSEANLPLFPRLLARIHHPRNTYAVHFDGSIPDATLSPVLADLAASTAYAANVVVMERAHLTYRGVSLVLNTLDAMEVALQSATPWTYWINLSGSDYPLVPITTQRRLLADPLVARKPRTFFTTTVTPSTATITHDRLGYLFLDPVLADFGDSSPAALNATARRSAAVGDTTTGAAAPAAATNLTPVLTDDGTGATARSPLYASTSGQMGTAEAWMILHRGFVAYAARGAAARRTLLAFTYAADAAEHYFISLVRASSVWRDSVLSNCLRDVRWTYKGRVGHQHPLTVDEVERTTAADPASSIGGATTTTTTAAPGGGIYPFEPALRESPKWYARKFQTPDSPLMNALDSVGRGAAATATATEYLRWLVQLADGELTLSSGDCDGSGNCV